MRRKSNWRKFFALKKNLPHDHVAGVFLCVRRFSSHKNALQIFSRAEKLDTIGCEKFSRRRKILMTSDSR